MKKGVIDKSLIPVSEIVTITAPVQVVIRDGEFTVKELVVAGKTVYCYQGLTNILLEKQREFDRHKSQTLNDW